MMEKLIFIGIVCNSRKIKKIGFSILCTPLEGNLISRATASWSTLFWTHTL